jgi:hypothetical protein
MHFKGRHDTQHNDSQPNDIQQKGLISNTQYENALHNVTLCLLSHFIDLNDIVPSAVMFNAVMLVVVASF